MKLFTQLYKKIDLSKSSSSKINALVEYFSAVSDHDKLWAIALFIGKRPRRIIDPLTLRLWVTDLINIPDWLFDECLNVVTDQAETIALLAQKDIDSEDKALSECIDELIHVRKQDPETIKEWVINSFRQLENEERILFTKVITGNFRKSISLNIITKGLSKYYGIDASNFAHRLKENWSPATANFKNFLIRENYKDNLSKPFRFQVATSIGSKLESIASPDTWIAEWKWSGIRCQYIYRNAELFLWSSSGELINSHFPELEGIGVNIDFDFVADGIIIAFLSGKMLPSIELHKILNRKTKPKTSQIDIFFMAFDLLEYRSEDVCHLELIQRKELLLQLKEESRSERLRISDSIEFTDWRDLSRKLNSTKTRKAESIILKKSPSKYTDQNENTWRTVKSDPHTINAVLTYVQRSQERGAQQYVEYTFGLWEDDVLISFTKTTIDLAEEDTNQINQFIRKNTIERFGPVLSVAGELVFEIAFESIHVSKRHKSGIILKNPRVNRWLKEFLPEDANSLEELKMLL